MKRLGEVLPKAMSCACFEARLGDDPQVDFIACWMAKDKDQHALSRCRSPRERPPAGLGGPDWDRVFRFCEDWADPASILHSQVPFIWLEFDIKAPPPAVPSPFLIFCVQPRFMDGPLAPVAPSVKTSPATTDRYRRLLRRGLSPLLDQPLSSDVEENLVRCDALLPESGHTLHVAPHNTRGRSSFRIVIAVSRDELPDYLRRIGWPGSMEQLSELLPAMFGTSSDLNVDLDVGSEVLPTIGLHSYYPTNDVRCQALLDQLVARGSCTPEKRDAALGWPGKSEMTLSGHKWPTTLYRTLEVKLVCRPKEPVVAKVYLIFEHRLALFA
ncbi:MAG TPA: hypothetical protein VE093_24635 [Polyangiaceae bacterium]|nr:hypothetical protein [Polyangiaceae bacterium]